MTKGKKEDKKHTVSYLIYARDVQNYVNQYYDGGESRARSLAAVWRKYALKRYCVSMGTLRNVMKVDTREFDARCEEFIRECLAADERKLERERMRRMAKRNLRHGF